MKKKMEFSVKEIRVKWDKPMDDYFNRIGTTEDGIKVEQKTVFPISRIYIDGKEAYSAMTSDAVGFLQTHPWVGTFVLVDA